MIQTLGTLMRDGKVKLASGTWDWRLRPQQNGAAVTFHSRERPQDEMRTWSSDIDLTPDRARDLALEPVERLWLDADGILWSIHVELPSDWHREERSGKMQALGLAFTCGSMIKTVAVPSDTKLGELTHFELTRLLNSA